MITWAFVYLCVKLHPIELPMGVLMFCAIMDLMIISITVHGIFGG